MQFFVVAVAAVGVFDTLRNMLPDIPIAISQPCHRFFHLEDFEFAYLSTKRCPYSRLKNVGEY